MQCRNVAMRFSTYFLIPGLGAAACCETFPKLPGFAPKAAAEPKADCQSLSRPGCRAMSGPVVTTAGLRAQGRRTRWITNQSATFGLKLWHIQMALKTLWTKMVTPKRHQLFFLGRWVTRISSLSLSLSPCTIGVQTFASSSRSSAVTGTCQLRCKGRPRLSEFGPRSTPLANQ